MDLIDTHCHIHAIREDCDDFTSKKWQDAGETDPDKIIEDASDNGVNKLVCVGTDLEDSRTAVDFVQDRSACWASIGVHPHEAKVYLQDNKDLQSMKELSARPKVVAVGEIGLDYYYEHSPRAEQIRLLEMFLQLASDKRLPAIFHIREAFDDFWPVFDNFKGIKGVLHSFTDKLDNLDKALDRGLYIGLNGIMTFTKDVQQLEAAKSVPLDRLVVETDSPYLTPRPLRGKVCKPEHVRLTAEFLSNLREDDFSEFARQTSQNAINLFDLR